MRDPGNGATAPIGLHPSNLTITKLRMDKCVAVSCPRGVSTVLSHFTTGDCPKSTTTADDTPRDRKNIIARKAAGRSAGDKSADAAMNVD